MENSETQFPCGYVEEGNGKLHLKIMGCSAFPNANSERFKVKLNVGIDAQQEKYQISLKSMEDDESEIDDSVENLSNGQYITLTELLKKHGAIDRDVIIATHDYEDMFRLFLHRSGLVQR